MWCLVVSKVLNINTSQDIVVGVLTDTRDCAILPIGTSRRGAAKRAQAPFPAGLFISGRWMDRSVARQRYAQQKRGAGQRGIEFKLTFEQWLEWWGEDLDRRGSGKESLQMQRFHDKGAYELGNIKKGYPRENSRTYQNCAVGRKSFAKQERASRLRDVLPASPKDNWLDELTEDEQELHSMFAVKTCPWR